MLEEPKHQLLTNLLSGITREELIWINGYIAGIIQQPETENKTVEDPVKPATGNKLTIVYGTETGNSRKLASEFAAKAKKLAYQVKLASLDQYRLSDLSREQNLLVVISTQGDGEPPVAAQKFYDHIHQDGFQLPALKYAVLALGDSSYPLFCKTGEDVDIQLGKSGAQRILPVCKCDVEYEGDAAVWFQQALDLLSKAAVLSTPKQIISQTASTVKPNKILYEGSVLSTVNLLDRKGKERVIQHLELLAEGVAYAPGDSIGIVPENASAAVQRIIDLLQVDPETTVRFREDEGTLRQILTTQVQIQYLHERVVARYAALVGQDIPAVKMDLLQLLQLYPPTHATWQELIDLLPAQSPRIYTIASSPVAHPDEIHLTVEQDRFPLETGIGYGCGSKYLTELSEQSRLSFFVQKNKRFRLPAPDRDCIFIGPGTGIAACRSFISEREATGATGKNWLFTGEENFATDFLYQTEIQAWLSTGTLQKLSLAFPGDDPLNTIWTRMQADAVELFKWIEAGAYILLSGEKNPMSVQVMAALEQVAVTQGHFDTANAASWLEALRAEGRFLKDVY